MNLNFSKGGGLIPAIIQHAITGKVLMLGYMNEEALQKTTESGLVTFYSRSRREIWIKGETSGNRLQFKTMQPDCDSDALLIHALPEGPTCHTGSESCFEDINPKGFLYSLEAKINNRIIENTASSYTNTLFRKGINKVAQKVGEEVVELIIEAKDDNRELFLNEASDLLYHLLVLFRAKNVTLNDVEATLAQRD